MADRFSFPNMEKCDTCPEKDNCENHNIYVHEVLLDCKSFYYVFCDLEEKSCLPKGDPQKFEEYEDELLAGKRPFLVPALVTNGVLAVELALKYLTIKETGEFECVHYIDRLFYSLPDVHKDILIEKIKAQAQQDDNTLKLNLKNISNYFVSWRYFFQNDSNAYTGFLMDFIHIVCDYAISTSLPRQSKT